MYGGHTYATYREHCGHDTPGVMRDGNVDFTHQDTSVDQARIEAVLDTLAVAGAHLLHVGIGNSRLAQRFASRAERIDGITVSLNEKSHAESLGLQHYTVYILNKHSREFAGVIAHTYDFVIDNNLASFACCKYHFHVMVESYLRLLKGHGRILTEQRGMDWYHGEVGWPMTDADLVSLESRFPVRVSRVTATVYALAARP